MNRYTIIMFMLLFNMSYMNAQVNFGPKLTSMGNNCAVVNDIWSIEANTAGITSISSPFISINHVNYFFDQEISKQALAFILPVWDNHLGFSLQRYGITAYNEIKLGIALARNFGNQLSIGIKINHHQIKISNYGSDIGFSADVGVMYKLNQQIQFGLYFKNPVNQQYQHHSFQHKLTSTFSVGVSYQLSDKLLIASTIRKNLYTKPDIGLGIDYQLIEVMSLRGGLSMKPFKQYGGIGLHHNKLILDLALENHPNLGYSPQVALAYAF